MFTAPLIACAISLPLFDTSAPPTPLRCEAKIEVVAGALHGQVTASRDLFVAAILLSDRDQLAHFFVLLPPLLDNHVVMGIGLGTKGRFDLTIAQGSPLPAGAKIYAQGVVADDTGIASSDVYGMIVPASR